MGSEMGCESLLSPFLCFAVLAVLVIDAAAQGVPTRWDHNGSELSPSANGSRDQFQLSAPVEVPTTRNYAEQNAPLQVQQRVPVEPAYDIEYGRFIQRMMSCLDPERPVALAMTDCDAALSYPYLVEDNRVNLLERRSELLRWQEQFGQKPIDVLSEKTTTNLFDSQINRIIVVLAFFFTIGLFATLRKTPASTAPLPAGEVGTQNTAEPSKSSSRNLFSKIANAVQRALTAETSPVTYSPYEPPSAPISLKLRRKERYTFTGKLMFVLDARMGLNAEDHRLVRKYRLGDQIMYDSRSRNKYAEKTRAHLELTKDQVPMSTGFTTQLFGLGKTIYRVCRACVSAIMTGSALRVTVDSLIRGAHLECDNMGELLDAENAIVEAGRNLKTYLKETTTFDGQEHIIEL